MYRYDRISHQKVLHAVEAEDESTVISLSCDSLLERATRLDQSFCAFSVPLIHFNDNHLKTLKCCILGKDAPNFKCRVYSLFLNTQQDLLTWGVCSEIPLMYIFSSKSDFYTAQNVRFWYSSEEAQLKDELFSNKGRCDWVSCLWLFPLIVSLVYSALHL